VSSKTTLKNEQRIPESAHKTDNINTIKYEKSTFSLKTNKMQAKFH
jgi:hypothetical protein